MQANCPSLKFIAAGVTITYKVLQLRYSAHGSKSNLWGGNGTFQSLLFRATITSAQTGLTEMCADSQVLGGPPSME